MADSSSANNRVSNKTAYQLLLISNLKKEIEMALRLEPEKFAAEVRKIGFSCQQCGKCCKQVCGDNRVAIIPSEIKKICEFTGLPRLEFVEPFVVDGLSPNELLGSEDRKVKVEMEKGSGLGRLLRDSGGVKEPFSRIVVNNQAYNKNNEDKPAQANKMLEFPGLSLEEIDSEGNIHAFGWILQRKKNGDCIFLEENTNKCLIYPARTMLCSTYPFYIEELSLQVCECEGLNLPISVEDSIKLAKLLLFRYISELEDALAMYEKFTDFQKNKTGPELVKKRLERRICSYIIHDSTGSNKITY